MKQYNYKMQWIFNKSEYKKALRLFGAKSFKSIHIRDIDLNVLHSFMNPHLNNPQTVNKDVTGWIELMFKKDEKCLQIEFVK